MLNDVQTAANFLRSRGVTHAAVGIILGTGLHQLSERIDVIARIPYVEIPGFVESTVESHTGCLLYGNLGGKKVLAMQGRFHLYEGYSVEQVVFPVRTLHAVGIQSLFISNAAGAVNLAWKKGELMLLTNHINLQGSLMPLIDTTSPTASISTMYDARLSALIKQIASEKNMLLREGIYAAVAGPVLETRAEYRYIRKMGADAVGMSTVPEVMMAAQLKIPCIAVSVLTDECDPDNLHPVTLAEIIEVANRSDAVLTELIEATIRRC